METDIPEIHYQTTGDSHPSLINFSPRMSSLIRHNSHLIPHRITSISENISFCHCLISETDNRITKERIKKKNQIHQRGEKSLSQFSRRNKVLSRNKEFPILTLMLTDNPLSKIVTCVSNRGALLQRDASIIPACHGFYRVVGGIVDTL